MESWSTHIHSVILRALISTNSRLCGYSPFQYSNQEIVDAIINGKFDSTCPEWNSISDEAKDFIKCLLKPELIDRMDIKQALSHPWLINSQDKKKPKVYKANQDVPIDLIDRDFPAGEYVPRGKLLEENIAGMENYQSLILSGLNTQ